MTINFHVKIGKVRSVVRIFTVDRIVLNERCLVNSHRATQIDEIRRLRVAGRASTEFRPQVNLCRRWTLILDKRTEVRSLRVALQGRPWRVGEIASTQYWWRADRWLSSGTLYSPYRQAASQQ